MEQLGHELCEIIGALDSVRLLCELLRARGFLSPADERAAPVAIAGSVALVLARLRALASTCAAEASGGE